MLTGYECQILRMVGLSEEDTSVTRRPLWWKTYDNYVHQEIRQLRGRMNAGMKTVISQGESKMIFLCSHICIYLFTYFLSFIVRRCKNECRETFENMEFARF